MNVTFKDDDDETTDQKRIRIHQECKRAIDMIADRLLGDTTNYRQADIRSFLYSRLADAMVDWSNQEIIDMQEW